MGLKKLTNMKKLFKLLTAAIMVLVAFSTLNVRGIFAMLTSTTETIENEFTLAPLQTFTITAEVIGGNATISGVPQTVFYEGNMTGDVVITPSSGYTMATARVYTGDEIDGEYDDTDGENIKAYFYKRNGVIKMAKKLTNVTDNKHIVITMQAAPIVAQVINVPGGEEGDLANTTSANGGYTILGHEYTSLEDAIADAQYINDLNNNNLDGPVRIKILADIDDEINTISTNNNVTIDLNGHTISIDNDANRVITVEDGASLTVVNTGVEINPNTGEESEIVNFDGVSILVKDGGELTLGVNDGRVTVATPTIEGETFGIYREPGSTLNFYDGKVIGNTNSALAGYLDNINTPELYEVVTDSAGQGREVSFVSIPADIEAMIGSTKYNTLEEAFEAVENDTNNTRNGTPTEIDVVAEVTIEDAIILSQNKNVVLDLNGHTITGVQANNVLKNNGKLEIKDSTGDVKENYIYSELVNNGTYYFTKVDDHLESNNYGIASSTANSYIKLDLSTKSAEETFSLVVNANISSQNNADFGYLTVTESTAAPAATATAGRFAYVSNINKPTNYTTSLTGGKVYYLHLGYTKNANTDNYLDTFMINDITLNGESVIRELEQGRGSISNANYGVIRNEENGDLKVSSGRIEGNYTGDIGYNNSSVYSTILNYGNLNVTSGKIYARANLAIENAATNAEKEVNLNGGLIYSNGGYADIINGTSGNVTINNGVRTYTTIRNFGDMVINGGKFTRIGDQYSHVIQNNKNIEINGGTYVLPTSNSAWAIYNESNSNFVIRNAAIKGVQGIYSNGLIGGKTESIDNVNIDLYGGTGIRVNSNTDNVIDLEINNSKINGTGYGILATSSKINTDNTITLNNVDVNVNQWCIGAIRNGAGALENLRYNVIVNGGTYISTANNAIFVKNVDSNEFAFEINDGTFTSNSAETVYVESGKLNVNGGTIIAKNTNNAAIYNAGITNIGTKNTAENTEVSPTNPTIISNYVGINNPNGTLNLYDGQIIAPNGNTIVGSINEIEEKNANGKDLGLIITSNAENETEETIGINISEIVTSGTEYERLYIDELAAVAKISKSAVGLDFTELTSNDYYSDENYYYFYKLSNAVKVCSEEAGNEVTEIEIISNILTLNKLADVLDGQNVEININGHQIESKYNGATITNNGTLNIIDTAGNGTIKVWQTALQNDGTASLNVNIDTLDKQSKLRGGFESNQPLKKLIINTESLNINGGTYTGYCSTVVENSGNLTINNGTINALRADGSSNGSWGVVNKGNGNLEINGGRLYNQNSTPAGMYYNSMQAISVYNANSATVKMNGGTIQTENYSFAFYNTSTSVYEEGVSEPSFHMTGGTITSGKNSGISYGNTESNEVWIKQAEGSTITISHPFRTNAKLVIEGTTINTNVENSGAATIIDNSTITGTLTATSGTNTINNSTISGVVTLSGSESTDEITDSQTGAITKSGAGILTIKNSTSSGINNNGNASIVIQNSTVNATTAGWAISNTNTGSITVKNSIINSEIVNTGEGTILIPSVGQTEIKTTDIWLANGRFRANGINNTGAGTIIIGTKGDGIVSTEYPYIENDSGYGIINSNANGKIYFYDGIVKARTGTILNGSLYETEEGYAFTTHDESTTKQYAILEKTAVAKILKTDLDSNNLVTGTYIELDTNYYGFYSLQDAVNVCTDNHQTEIVLIDDITYTATDESQKVAENKDIVLDLAGHTINFGNENGIIISNSNAKLKITDSSETVGALNGTNGTIISNTGTLTIEKIRIIESKAGTSSEYVNAIINTGTVELDNITTTTGNYSTILENSGTATINGGTYSGPTTSKFINNTGTGNVVVDGTTVATLFVYNNDQGTIKMIDMTFTGGIKNYSSKVYQAGVSEPAIHLVGGHYQISALGSSTGPEYYYSIYNNAGEMIIENNTTHQTVEENLLNIVGYNMYRYGYVKMPDMIQNNNGTVRIKSGTYDCNIINNQGNIEITDGTFVEGITNKSGNTSTFTVNGGTIQGGITNEANATMNLNSGYFTNSTYTKSITNAGIMNIGQNDGTITSYTDIPLDGENNKITNIGAPILEGSINSTGVVNFYDGIIIANNSNEVCYKYIDDIPVNTAVIHTNFDTYHTYSLSANTVVATIGADEYYTLESAFEACKNTTGNKTIVMQKSVALTRNVTIENDNNTQGYLEITENSDVTLDLNGINIQGLCEKTMFVNNGTFEITDNNGGTAGSINTYSNGLVYNTGNLEISAGTYTVNGDNSRTIIENVGTGTVEISGGTYNTVNKTSSIRGIGISSTSTGNITVSGGTFNCKGVYGIGQGTSILVNNTDTNNKPTVTISNSATISQNEYANGFTVTNVNLNITGGTNNCTANANTATNSVVTISGGTTAGGITFTNCDVDVTGGTVSGTITLNANSTFDMTASGATVAGVSNSGTASITAGTLTGMFTNSGAATVENATFTTTGGVANNGSGTLEITNSSITTTSTAISNSGNGTLTVTGVTVSTTGIGVTVSNGTVTIEDSSIQAGGNYGINTTGGTLNIPYTTSNTTANTTEIEATAGIGLYMNGGTVNLGDLAYPAYKTTPQITGKTYGVKVDSGTFNFYDGILRSTDNEAFYGTIGATPELYSVVFEDSTKTTAYLGIEATTESVVKVGSLNYSSIAAGINVINNSQSKEGTIVFLKDAIITSPLIIPAGTNITFDMQAHSLRYSGTDSLIVNNGTLTIIDSLAATSTTIGYIDNLQGTAIENKGTLTIGENDGTLHTRAPRIIGRTYGIENTASGATLNFYDGMIEGKTNAVNGTILTDTTLYTLTSGTEVRTYGAENITYRTTYLTEN